MIFTWKIIDVFAEENTVIQVKYSVIATEGNKSVSTEGYWTFLDKNHQIYEQTAERDLISWIKAESVIDDVCIIEANLEKQLNSTQAIVKKPWVKPTFTVKI
jgi:hypothetical protein